MGFLKPDITSRQPRSQASPLSDELIKFLTEMITGNAEPGSGGPFGAAQQGLADFATARSSPEQFLELMGPLREMFNRETDRQVAQTTESFGASGNRLSTGLAREGGRQRTERGTNLDALISQLFLSEQENLLKAFELMRSPFLDIGKLGILPEDTIVNDSPFVTGANIFGNLASGAGDVITAVKG